MAMKKRVTITVILLALFLLFVAAIYFGGIDDDFPTLRDSAKVGSFR